MREAFASVPFIVDVDDSYHNRPERVRVSIDQDNLEANLANTQAGGVANVEYSLEDAQKVISSAM